MFVAADLIRSLEPAGSDGVGSGNNVRGARFRIGQEVEARYRGKTRYYAGKINLVNADDTYDIAYHDGEKEFSVRGDFIRPLAGSLSSPSQNASTLRSTTVARPTTPEPSPSRRFRPSALGTGRNLGAVTKTRRPSF